MINNLFQIINQRKNRKYLYSSDVYWNKKAQTYSGSSVSMWANQSLNLLYDKEQKELINSYLLNVENLSILDLGCGTGRFSNWFSEKNANVTAIDFSIESLNIAKKTCSTQNIKYYHQSLFDLNDTEAYDIIFTWGVLTIACLNNDQLCNALIKIKKALRSNGTLLIVEPIHENFLHRVLPINNEDFCKILQEAGFNVEKKSHLHFWPMRLLLAYISFPMWITKPVYHLGQTLMKLPKLKKLGDYTAILAKSN